MNIKWNISYGWLIKLPCTLSSKQNLVDFYKQINLFTRYKKLNKKLNNNKIFNAKAHPKL